MHLLVRVAYVNMKMAENSFSLVMVIEVLPCEDYEDECSHSCSGKENCSWSSLIHKFIRGPFHSTQLYRHF